MPIFNRTAFNNAVFNTGEPVVAKKKPRGYRPIYDMRVMRDDEEVMNLAAMFITELGEC